jgi:hypothetical protein
MGEDFELVWQSIVARQGDNFQQKLGKPFRYSVDGKALRPTTTNQNLSRSEFKRAWERRPLLGPGQLQDLRGPSYIFAILVDPRISGSNAY